MFMFFIVVLIVLLFRNFICLCIVMLCMYVLLEYLSMVIVSFILCMWCAEEWHLPSTVVKTINQSINSY